MTVSFARRALRDLEEIFDYVAADSPEAAERVRRAILDAISIIAARPYLGIKNARAPNMRSKLVFRYPYRIHYLVQENGIFVVHIRHSSRKPWSGER